MFWEKQFCREAKNMAFPMGSNLKLNPHRVARPGVRLMICVSSGRDGDGVNTIVDKQYQAMNYERRERESYEANSLKTASTSSKRGATLKRITLPRHSAWRSSGIGKLS
jgi:hypothetical protein